MARFLSEASDIGQGALHKWFRSHACGLLLRPTKSIAYWLCQAPQPTKELLEESDQLHSRAVGSLTELLQQVRRAFSCTCLLCCQHVCPNGVPHHCLAGPSFDAGIDAQPGMLLAGSMPIRGGQLVRTWWMAVKGSRWVQGCQSVRSQNRPGVSIDGWQTCFLFCFCFAYFPRLLSVP